MDRQRPDDDRLRQNNEAAFSKKMKITIIMLSLVLMILLLPLAGEYGLPLLKPMGASLRQRLWDAMRFIAMTAAISVGIISTSSTHNQADGSSHRRSSSSLHGSSSTSMASTSREESNPYRANNSNSFRSDYSSRRHAPNIPRGGDGSGNHRQNINQIDDLQKRKGKEVMNDHAPNIPRGGDGSGNHRQNINQIDNLQKRKGKKAMNDPTSYVGSPSQSIESQIQREDLENFNQFPLKPGGDHSGYQGWDSTFKSHEVMEGDFTSRGEYQLLSNGVPSSKNIMSKEGLQKESLVGIEDEVTNRNGKSQIVLKDDNYTELRMSNNAMSHGADEYLGKKGSKHRRSSSVDWQRPGHVNDHHNQESSTHKSAKSLLAAEFGDQGVKHRRSSSVDRRNSRYVYDGQSPDQPGLKQILMEISRESQSKLNRSGSRISGNKAYQTNERFSDQVQSPMRNASNPVNVPPSSAKRPLQTNVNHQAPVLMNTNSPSDSIAIKKCAEAKSMGIDHKQQNPINMASLEFSESEDDAGKMGVSMWRDQRKHTNLPEISLISGHKQVKGASRFSTNVQQVNEADHAKTISIPNQIDVKKVANVGQNVVVDGVSNNERVSSLQKKPDQVTVLNEKPVVGNTKHGLQFGARAGEGKDKQVCSDHSEGRKLQLQKGNISSLHRQSSQHSRSDVDLKLLRQADQSKEQAMPWLKPSSRDRKSVSYDFGDSFDPNWFLALEPPPPPHLLFSPEGRQQLDPSMVNEEMRGIMTRSFVDSLVPWRSPSPIDFSSFPRSVSPLEALSLAQDIYPSRQELQQKSDQFISNFNTRLINQRKKSLERQRGGSG